MNIKKLKNLLTALLLGGIMLGTTFCTTNKQSVNPEEAIQIDEEAYYPETTRDADGDELDGSKHSYVLHFDTDKLPPAKASWSHTMYKLTEQLLVENEINRYKIGDATEGLKYNADGTLDIYIQ